MRKYESIMVEAELMALSPEAVRARLIEYAGKAERSDLDPELDENAEEALRLRGDPLIDLSLAQFARYSAVVKPIFHSNSPGSALRLAALSNKNMRNGFAVRFPDELFDTDEDLVELLVSGNDEELSALFENPTLHNRFLRSVLERSGELTRVPDDRLVSIVLTLTKNPRMRTERDDSYMDGLDEYDYDAVFHAAWALSLTVEPSIKWANALSWLYASMLRKGSYMMKPLEVAQRWRIDPTNAELKGKDEAYSMPGFLSRFEMVRMGLARLAGDGNQKLLGELLTHEDRAFRAAAYIDCELTREIIDSAFEKDGELVFQNAIGNTYLWRSAEGREMLRSLAWMVNRADRSGHLDAPNQFNSAERHMEKLHPAWFKDEPAKDDNDQEEIDTDKEPATKADLAQAFVLLQKEMEKNKPGKTLDWIFWITIFTAIYVFFKLS